MKRARRGTRAGGPLTLTFRELGGRTWSDFERLMRGRGGNAACWCMYYRKALSAEREMATYRVKPRDRREHNRKRMKALAEAGCAHGILAYEGEKPVGWCAYGRKSEFPQIDRGRAYRKLPPAPEDVWRIVCFVVAVGHRRKGVASATLRAALESIRRQGGGLVEAYPAATPEQGRYRLWFGTRSMFQREGFQEVAGLGSSVLVRKILPSGK